MPPSRFAFWWGWAIQPRPTGAPLRSQRELGVAPPGAGRAASRERAAAGARGGDHRAHRDEVSGAGGTRQSGRLPADGRSLRPPQVSYARGRGVVCRLARRLAVDAAADSGAATVVSESAAAARAGPGGRRTVARAGNGGGHCQPGGPAPGGRRGDGRRPVRGGAAQDRAGHRAAQPSGRQDSTKGTRAKGARAC